MKVSRRVSPTWIGVFLILLHFQEWTTGLELCPVDCNPPGHPIAPNGETILEGIYQYPTRNSSSKNQQPTHQTQGETPEGGCPYTSKDAVDLLQIIDKMVNRFYAHNDNDGKSSINVGLEVLKGQLDYMLVSDRVLSSALKAKLEKLQKSSGDILDQALKIQNGQDFKKEIGSQVLNPIPIWHALNAINKHFSEFQNIGNEKEVLDDGINLRCFSSLSNDCSIDAVCKEAYLTKIHSQYMLTHQVIYQRNAEQGSCPSVNPTDFENAKEYRDRLCSKAYLEAEFLQSHNFPTRFIDLFAEQVGFCGLMGYPNFLKSDWLREIMSWEEGSASGCMPDLYGREKPIDTVIRVPVIGREDGATEEECLVHLTFVSLVAFSVNLRYMVDACEPSLFDDYFKAQL